MDIQYYVSLFWRRKFIILATTLATLVPAVMYAQSLEPIYRSYATLRFSTSLTGDQTWVSYDIDYTERIVNTYTALATTGPVLDVVRQRVGTEDLPTITVAGITSTELIAITVEGSDPELNTDVANALGDILTERDIDMFRDDTGSSQQILEDLRAGTTAEIQLLQVNLNGLEEGSNAAIATQARINLLEQRFQALDDQVTALTFVQSTRDQQVNFIERAIVPHSPEGPNGTLFIILGAMAGFAGGIALSLLFHMNDDRMYTHEEIKSTVTSPIIGRLPKYKVHNVLDMFAAERGKFEREMLRRVATQVKLVLRDLDNIQGKPILMVTSASTGEGKTSFVSGLSLALKDLGMNPLVVDGDLRRPTIHTLFEVPNQMGLSDYIARDVNDLNILINKSAVDVLPAGEQGEMSNHLGMVAQQLFKTLRFDISDAYDIIVVDSPPYFAVSDTTIMIDYVDAVLPVLWRKRSTYTLAEKLDIELNERDVTVIGFIENNANLSQEKSQYRRYRRKFKRSKQARSRVHRQGPNMVQPMAEDETIPTRPMAPLDETVYPPPAVPSDDARVQ